jgi:hypothetical protein
MSEEREREKDVPAVRNCCMRWSFFSRSCRTWVRVSGIEFRQVWVLTLSLCTCCRVDTV